MNELDQISALQKKYLLQCWGKQENYNPISIERTEECYLYTTDGRKIFDLRSAHECINLGFKNPYIISSIKKQLEDIIYVTDDFATEPTSKLAKKISEISPGDGDKKVWFGQSGADAVEAAIKTAKLYKFYKLQSKTDISEKDFINLPYRIISRYRSWHGATMGASSVSGDPRRWFNEPIFNSTLFAPEAYCFRCPLKQIFPGCNLACADYVDHIIEMEGGENRIAAIILEPIVGSNGIIPPPDGYFKRIREICTKWDIVLIIDETMSGFGRTGKMFAIEHYDIIPDIIIMGKALGVYVPLTAMIIQPHISKIFEKNIFGHGQSYSGHTLGCAAALAGIEFIENENILEKTFAKGKYLEEKLNRLRNKHWSIGDIRGIGLMWTIEIIKNNLTKEPIKKVTEKYKETVIGKISKYLLDEKNIYVPSDKFGIWIVPPLIVTYEELDYIIEAIDEALIIADNEQY
ncbi:MAG: aspartate aminotransferase family protein [Ignavibacteriae bacterium]|nr:aspartate aminotransferase family protein [Ignavibacteriota bacterium]